MDSCPIAAVRGWLGVTRDQLPDNEIYGFYEAYGVDVFEGDIPSLSIRYAVTADVAMRMAALSASGAEVTRVEDIALDRSKPASIWLNLAKHYRQLAQEQAQEETETECFSVITTPRCNTHGEATTW